MQDSLLKKQVQQLELSESFKEMAFNHGIHTLEELLNWPVNVLLEHEGFTYHHYQELRNFLKEKNSVHLLKTKSS